MGDKNTNTPSLRATSPQGEPKKPLLEERCQRS